MGSVLIQIASYRVDVHDVSHGSGMDVSLPRGFFLDWVMLGMGFEGLGGFRVGQLLTIDVGT